MWGCPSWAGSSLERKVRLALAGEEHAQTPRIASPLLLLLRGPSPHPSLHPTHFSDTSFVQVMNWTGGSLQRTKKANAGMLQQQKAYFAKARTKPQNTPRTPVAPFCPSFLRDNDQLGPRGLPSFGSRSVRRGERSTTSGGETAQREHVVGTPKNKRTAISGRGVSPREVSSRRVTHHVVHPKTPPQAQQDLRSSKRKAPESDAEIQLFETNRKRLLTQHDWIGINPSKPVSLKSLAYKQNEQIGMRRIMNEKSDVAKSQHVNGRSTRGEPDLQDRTFARLFQGGTKREKPEDIRVRIGTNALTDTLSDFARVEGYTESDTCSDLMLFEQNGPLTDESLGQARSEPSVMSQNDVPMNAGEHDDPLPQASVTGRDARHYEDVPDRTEWTLDNDGHDRWLKEQLQCTRRSANETESPGVGFRLVDPARDDEYSLRLVFSGSSDCSTGVRTHNLGVEDRQEPYETELLGEPELTIPYEAKRVHGMGNDSESWGAYAIVDPEPWTACVAISDDCPKPIEASMDSRQPLQLNTRDKSGDPSSWSQCATQGQGDGESFDMAHSDCLALLRRGVRKPMTESVTEINADRQSKSNAAYVQTLDEDEMNWQAFVFG